MITFSPLTEPPSSEGAEDSTETSGQNSGILRKSAGGETNKGSFKETNILTFLLSSFRSVRYELSRQPTVDGLVVGKGTSMALPFRRRS